MEARANDINILKITKLQIQRTYNICVAICLFFGKCTFVKIIHDVNPKLGLPQSRYIKSVASWSIMFIEIIDFRRQKSHHGE